MGEMLAQYLNALALLVLNVLPIHSLPPMLPATRLPLHCTASHFGRPDRIHHGPHPTHSDFLTVGNVTVKVEIYAILMDWVYKFQISDQGPKR